LGIDASIVHRFAHKELRSAIEKPIVKIQFTTFAREIEWQRPPSFPVDQAN
jgi:hypothetical protein